MRAIPVFMYHHVNWHEGDLVTLSPAGFEAHLRVLQERGFETLFLEELLPILRGERLPSRPAAALTFDDGHLDNWVFAFPLLRKYGMKATIFVITSWMEEGEIRGQWTPDGAPGGDLPPIPRHGEAKKKAARREGGAAMNWEEARAMEASGWVDIQSHTHWHRDYFSTAGGECRLPPENREPLKEDLIRSRKLIEARLQKKCRFLAWPWGRYDSAAQAMAREAGFEAVVTTEKGVNLPASGATSIRRIVAKSGDRGWFSRRLSIYSRAAVGRLYSRFSGRI